MGILSESDENKLPRSVYVRRRLDKLLRHDKIRAYKILEIIQYTIIYSVLGFLSAVLFDMCLPNYNAKVHIGRIVLETITQLVLFSVAIFYISKVAKLIPLVVENDSEYHPYLTEEYVGGIALGIMFIRVQPNFLDKLKHIAEWIRALSV